MILRIRGIQLRKWCWGRGGCASETWQRGQEGESGVGFIYKQEIAALVIERKLLTNYSLFRIARTVESSTTLAGLMALDA
jgi:hypothetical protein